MVRLREIPRTAAFAWSPGARAPLIATGTRAGAVDADFSNETVLELWELGLDTAGQGAELTPVASISADSRFHDIAWGQPTEAHPRGIIAGALENGSLHLWDAQKLLDNASDAHISETTKHSGPIKALQFNPQRPEILATGGAKGELYITDVNSPDNAFRLGTSAARADDIESLDWNKKVPHILVTGSSGGFVTVWNVKEKKENLTLNNYGRKSVSAVAWDPTVPTRLITAVPNDMDPLILSWDLRNSNAPERILKGHDQGVLSLDWCGHDADLLLSCGKDNRTICWNPHTGDILGEFPIVTNWTFQTRFNPHNPSLLATASFDGKIAIQTIQNTNKDDQTTTKSTQNLDGEDFFAKAQSQPQGAAFSLPKAPKWLQRPVGVSFGFGGKLIKLSTDADTNKSTISISTFAADTGVGAATEEFERSLKDGNLSQICESKIANSKSEEEKADWTVIETLISGNARKKLVDYLGFADAAPTEEPEAETNGKAEDKDGSAFFEGGEGDSFLSDLAATKGARTNNPFKIYSGQESEADKNITQALIMGKFEQALDICLKEDRLSDAFMIAICGGQKCIDKAQAAYFKGKANGPNYLRLLASVVGKNLWDVVHNADLENWKEAMATLCTFADQSEFPDLCEALGDRLEEARGDSSDPKSLRKDASFCYLAGSKLEKVVTNWVQELQEKETVELEQAENETSFSVHAKSLQDFIEKVTIFRQVTNFQDSELGQADEWKLGALYAKYTEYADVVAAHGQLEVAEKYLDLLPAQYPAADVARNRVKQATKKAAPVAQRQAPAAATQRTQRVVPGYTANQPTAPLQQSAPSPYAPLQQQTPAPNAPQAAQLGGSAYPAAGGRSYTPIGYQQQQPGLPQPGPYGNYQAPQQQSIPPPPRSFTSSPSVPPASQRNVPNWNDTPDFGPKAPPPRRGTPSVVAPFPNQNQQNSGPPMSPQPGFNQGRPTPPPPPKGPLGSTAAMPPPQGTHAPPRPSSSASNAYAPPAPPAGFAPPPVAPPRGASPYNPPPATGPPSNRYAPAPGSQPTPPAGGFQPPRSIAPPSNPYAAAPSPYPPQPSGLGVSQSPPPAVAPQGPPRGPPQGPPRAGPPGGPPQGPPRLGTPSSSGPPQPAAAPSAPKYPAGDRSHMSASNRQLYETLNADMQRVSSKAPASYRPQVMDTEKRINILFDHLNNEEVVKPDTIQSLHELAQALQGRNYEHAMAISSDIMKTKNDQGSNWIVGVQRLIKMSKATP